MNLRPVLNIATIFLFFVLTLQTCLALSVEVFCLTGGMVVFGALAYLALSELWVLLLLDTRGFTVPATVVAMRQNQVGWQRLQVEMVVPAGTLQKWTDDISRTTKGCKHAHEIGDQVTVMLSNDWQHCRLLEPSTSLCQVGTVITILSLAAAVATWKMLFLTFLLVTRRACKDTCHTLRCEDEFDTRVLYAILVGATVYINIFFVVQRRYLDSLPSLTKFEILRRSDDSSRLETWPEDPAEQPAFEMTALRVPATSSSDGMEVV